MQKEFRRVERINTNFQVVAGALSGIRGSNYEELASGDMGWQLDGATRGNPLSL